MSKERQLLFRLTRKDFIVEAKRGSGKGGQNRNVTNSACRISHPPSGAVGQAQDERDYKQNEKLAFERLLATKEFKTWHQMECARRMGILAEVDQRVEQMMQPENLRVEVKDKGKWVKAPNLGDCDVCRLPRHQDGSCGCDDKNWKV